MPLESIILPHFLLTNNYEELYTSVRYDEQSFSSIISEHIDDIKSQCIVSDIDPDCDFILLQNHTHIRNMVYNIDIQ